MQQVFEAQLRSMIGEGDCFVLMAVSGGVDSMVMASLFRASPYQKIAIAHVNFGLRGDDSDADEALVQHWAHKAAIPFYVQRFDTLVYSKEHKVSVEMAARELRYQWFEELRQPTGADYIAVAHNANDHAETVLLNLTRGTGIRGLCGIPGKRDAIIRPMLCFERAHIMEYAQKLGTPYREDASNALYDFARNRIRHAVLPELRKINPQIIKQLCQDSRYLREAYAVLEKALERKRSEWCRQDGEALYFEIEKIAADAYPAFHLFELLRPYGFCSGQMKQIIDMLHALPGHKVLSDTHILYKDRGVLALFPQEQESTLPSLHISLFEGKTYHLHKSPNVAALDVDKLQFPLTLRRWNQGYRFTPFGMHGSKKVSDFLTDIRLPLWEKERQLVVCSGNDIVWVAGRRIDEQYKVTEVTERVAEVVVTNHPSKPLSSQTE